MIWCKALWLYFFSYISSLRRHCGASCTSGSSACVEGDIPYSCTHQAAAAVLGSAGRGCPPTTPVNTSGDMTLNSRGNRGSLISTTSSAASKPRSVVTLAGLIGDSQQQKDSWLKAKVCQLGNIVTFMIFFLFFKLLLHFAL